MTIGRLTLMLALLWTGGLLAQTEYSDDDAPVEAEDDLGFKKEKRFKDRLKVTIYTHYNLSFLRGSDARTVRDQMVAAEGSSGIVPRSGFAVGNDLAIEVVDDFSVMTGIGYHQRGWWERRETVMIQSLNAPAGQRRANFSIDYIRMPFGVEYTPVDWLTLNTSFDMNLALLNYARYGRWEDFLFETLPANVRVFVPGWTFQTSFNVDGLSIDLRLDLTGRALENRDYGFVGLGVGVRYDFFHIPGPSSL